MLFSFSHPQYLVFLFAIPLFIAIHFYSLSNRKKNALNFANFEAISRIKGIDFFSKNIIMLILNLIVLVLMVLAVSGLTYHTLAETSSFSFVVVVDSSQSMEADDFSPNRLNAAKDTAIDFVRRAPTGVEIGVVSFSGSSYIIQDVSQDKVAVVGKLESIEISRYGGTDIFEAVITSTNLLSRYEHKAIILLSDGQLNVGTVEDIIDYANENDVLIHTIAVGTLEGGETTYGTSKLNEDSLRSLSYNTGGKHFSATNQELLSQSFLDILNLTNKKVSINLTAYLILSAILLFGLVFFLSNTRYLSII